MILTVFEEFKKITSYNIELFFNKFLDFIEKDYQKILDYYQGGNLNKFAFVNFEELKLEASKIEPLIDQYSENFNTTNFWGLINNFTEIQNKLETCENLGKWQRSSRVGQYSENLKITHIQKQNETLEKISKDSGFTDVDYWSEIAVQNQIIEEDYTNKGGTMLKVSIANDFNSSIDNIVDYLIGDNIYGKDVVKKIEILSDGGLSVCSGKKAIHQTFNTIMTTFKNGIPEFPDDGIPAEILGANENIIHYPIIFRNILSMIQKDKRFSSLELLDIKKEQDSILIELQVSTVLGDSLVNNIIV